MKLQEALDEFMVLMDEQKKLEKQVKADLIVFSMGKEEEGFDFVTRHGQHWCKTILRREEEITVERLETLLSNAVSVHTRFLPEWKATWERMQELNKIIQETND